MKLLSNECVQQVSGGYSKAEYDSHTHIWGLIGLFTAAASVSTVLPATYASYFAVRMAFMGAGSLAGYAFGAFEYSACNFISSSLDNYLAPAE